MNFFNRKKKEPQPEPERIAPGEVKVDRNWTDNPQTDTTVITIGGQVDSKTVVAIKTLLEGKAHIRHYPSVRKGNEMPGMVAR